MVVSRLQQNCQILQSQTFQLQQHYDKEQVKRESIEKPLHITLSTEVLESSG